MIVRTKVLNLDDSGKTVKFAEVAQIREFYKFHDAREKKMFGVLFSLDVLMQELL